MSHKELSDALDVIHRELSQSQNLDADDVKQLRKTISDIELALHQRAQSSAELSQDVTRSATSFETSHPRLTETLGRVADMLQQMGI